MFRTVGDINNLMNNVFEHKNINYNEILNCGNNKMNVGNITIIINGRQNFKVTF